MTNNEYTPFGPKLPARTSRPGEVIFRMVKGGDTRRIEFRRHDGAGVEVQLYEDDEFFWGRTFETEWLARTEATRQREAFEATGWRLVAEDSDPRRV